MKVLLVEPDGVTAQMAELMLKAEGFNVYATDLAEDAADLAPGGEYDAIVTALQLPDGPATAMIKHLRAAKCGTAVLVVDVDPRVETKVAALAAGADDYLTKPFHRDELTARLRAIIRRSRGQAADLIACGPITLDLGARRMMVGDTPVHLTAREYDIVECMMLRLGRTISKEGILAHAYGGLDEPELKIVDVFVCKVRKKLAALCAETHLETVWGQGYRMTPTPEGGGKQAAGASVRLVADKVMAALGAAPTGLRFEEVRDAAAPCNSSTLYQVLGSLRNSGRLVRSRVQYGPVIYRQVPEIGA